MCEDTQPVRYVRWNAAAAPGHRARCSVCTCSSRTTQAANRAAAAGSRHSPPHPGPPEVASNGSVCSRTPPARAGQGQGLRSGPLAVDPMLLGQRQEGSDRSHYRNLLGTNTISKNLCYYYFTFHNHHSNLHKTQDATVILLLCVL